MIQWEGFKGLLCDQIDQTQQKKSKKNKSQLKQILKKTLSG